MKIIKNKKIYLIVILLLVIIFSKYYYIKESSWRFEKDGYSMELILYKNILGEKKGSYCYYEKFIANCPFSKKQEGEWDKNKINIFHLKDNEYSVKDNRSYDGKQAFIELIEKDNILKWALNKEKTKDYFNIPHNIELHKID